MKPFAIEKTQSFPLQRNTVNNNKEYVFPCKILVGSSGNMDPTFPTPSGGILYFVFMKSVDLHRVLIHHCMSYNI